MKDPIYAAVYLNVTQNEYMSPLSDFRMHVTVTLRLSAKTTRAGTETTRTLPNSFHRHPPSEATRRNQTSPSRDPASTRNDPHHETFSILFFFLRGRLLKKISVSLEADTSMYAREVIRLQGLFPGIRSFRPWKNT